MDAGTPISVLLKEAKERLAAVSARSLADLADGELVEVTATAVELASMVDAVCARSVAAVDAAKAWVPDGASCASAWVAWRCRVPKGRARSLVQIGRRLRDLPGTDAAVARGDITLDHARLLGSAQQVNPALFAECELELLDAARALLFSQFEKVIRYWRYAAAPDDEEARARQRWLDRRAHCSTTFEGNVVLGAQLDPAGGAIFQRELDRLARDLYDQDLAQARERLGVHDVPLHELGRTPAQRRADALVLMATRSAAKPPGAVEGRTLAHVLIGADTLARMCELSTGQVLTPGEALPLLTNAEVQRAVFDPKGTKVLDLGPRRRLFTGPTRTAIQLRDQGCTHPTCAAPIDRCEIDHIHPYANGGPTTQDNGRCRCPYHHRRSRDG
jgi:hypothetical protein